MAKKILSYLLILLVTAAAAWGIFGGYIIQVLNPETVSRRQYFFRHGWQRLLFSVVFPRDNGQYLYRARSARDPLRRRIQVTRP